MSDTEFPKKYAKIVDAMPEFKDAADAASGDDLKKIIVTCESNIYEAEKAKEADQKLNAAKELVKDMSGPHRDAVKALTAKVKYALFRLESMGISTSDKDED